MQKLDWMATQRERWGEDSYTEGGRGKGVCIEGGMATQFKRRNCYWCRKRLDQLLWRCVQLFIPCSSLDCDLTNPSAVFVM